MLAYNASEYNNHLIMLKVSGKFKECKLLWISGST